MGADSLKSANEPAEQYQQLLRELASRREAEGELPQEIDDGFTDALDRCWRSMTAEERVSAERAARNQRDRDIINAIADELNAEADDTLEYQAPLPDDQTEDPFAGRWMWCEQCDCACIQCPACEMRSCTGGGCDACAVDFAVAIRRVNEGLAPTKESLLAEGRS